MAVGVPSVRDAHAQEGSANGIVEGEHVVLKARGGDRSAVLERPRKASWRRRITKNEHFFEARAVGCEQSVCAAKRLRVDDATVEELRVAQVARSLEAYANLRAFEARDPHLGDARCSLG